MIDIVTVVFRDELPVLKLQAQSIDLFCNDIDLEKIIVIVNDDGLDLTEIDIGWWGKFSNQVVVMHRRAWPIEYPNNGWLTQQLLKLLGAYSSSSAWAMVLDAKTLLVQPVDPTRLFDSKGRSTWGYWPVIPVFKQSQKIVSELFEINLKNVAGPQGVPFFFNIQVIKELIPEVEKRSGKKFSTWFLDQGMVTEFILYSGYVEYRDGTLDRLYSKEFKKRYDCCNICHSEVNEFDRKYQGMLSDNNLTVSIHRDAWAQLTLMQKELYQNLLISKGISNAKELL